MSDDKVKQQAEEDLSKAPTPETRRADGEAERDRDTSDGPTPETREADAAAKRD